MIKNIIKTNLINIIAVGLIFLTSVTTSADEFKSWGIFDIGTGWEITDEERMGETDTDDGSLTFLNYQRIMYFEDSGLTVIPELDAMISNKTVFDKEDRLTYGVSIAKTESGSVYYPLVPNSNTTTIFKLWGQEAEIDDIDDNKYGASLGFVNMRKEFISYDDQDVYLRLDGSIEKVEADRESEEGKSLSFSVTLGESQNGTNLGGWQWHFPRVYFNWFDPDDSDLETEFVKSIQGTIRYVHVLEKYNKWAIIPELTVGYDDVDDFNGTDDDFTSAYAFFNVKVTRNPLMSIFGGGSGGSSGGRWYRP